MKIYKTLQFAKFADKEGISDKQLITAVEDIGSGHFDANLGGDVYKQRIARQGGGKSGGYRIIICFRQNTRSIFVYGFSKAKLENIPPQDEREIKELAKILLALPDNELMKMGRYLEIPQGE